MRKPGNMRKREIIIIYLIFGVPAVIYRGIVGCWEPRGAAAIFAFYTDKTLLGSSTLDGIFLFALIFILFYPWFRGVGK